MRAGHKSEQELHSSSGTPVLFCAPVSYCAAINTGMLMLLRKTAAVPLHTIQTGTARKVPV